MSLGVLDQPHPQQLEWLTDVCTSVFHVPIALVSLVDEHRQWFLAKSGLEAPETPREMSFCGHAILNPDHVFVVLDTWKDPRFAQNSLVRGGPHIRFYAGVPLVVEHQGQRLSLGTLCVIDIKPREEFTPNDEAMLNALSGLARDYLQSRLPAGLRAFPSRKGKGDSHEMSTSGTCANNVDQLMAVDLQKLQFKSRSDALCMVRTSDPSLAIMVASPGWAAVTGWPLDQTLGSPFLSFFSSQKPQAIAADGLRAKLAGTTDATVEGYMPCHGGGEIWASMSLQCVSQLDVGGGGGSGGGAKAKDSLWLVHLQDRTSQKNTELEMAKAREIAENSARSKAQFLANISHELRTPMNAINACSMLLSEEQLTNEQHELVSMVRCSAQQMIALLNQVLDFSKVEAAPAAAVKDGQKEAEPVNIRQCIEEVMETVSIIADKKRLNLGYHLQPDMPEMWGGDIVRLRQVLINLCTNAVKFTDCGSICIRVSLGGTSSHATEVGQDTMLHFEVEDTGRGIPAQDVEKVFLPFEQVDGTLTRDTSGTGLGLSISKVIVERSGGRIWLESEMGKGSVFKFNIPMQRLQVNGLGNVTSTDAATKVRRKLEGVGILVVSDSQVVGFTVVQLLQRLGIQQAERCGPEEIESILGARGRNVGLVIMDRPTTVTQSWIQCGQAVLGWAERATGSSGLHLGDSLPIALLYSRGAPAMSHMHDLTYAVMADTKLSGFRDHSASTSVASGSSSEAVGGMAGTWQGLFYERQTLKVSKPVTMQKVSDLLVSLLPPESPRHLVKRARREEGHAAEQSHSARILVCEDNPINQRVLSKVLMSLGYTQIKLANNGAEGLAALEKHPYDVVLMDLHMPVMDGLEASRRIKADEVKCAGGKKPTVVAVTADVMANIKETCSRVGITEFLHKPIRRERLAEVISKATQVM
mmetsp:Transcript_4728/g.13256  ORF Transcript_4728/g.13256 Transcript_4728/m.13256 type:complete len:926 (-) Transcript_4728:84-2861(-)